MGRLFLVCGQGDATITRHGAFTPDTGTLLFFLILEAGRSGQVEIGRMLAGPGLAYADLKVAIRLLPATPGHLCLLLGAVMPERGSLEHSQEGL